MGKDDKRFVWCESEGVFKCTAVIVDTKTGVNSLFVQSGYGGGVTPLIDENGKPIITKHIVQ